MVTEKVTVIAEMIDNLTGKTKQVTNSVQTMNKGIQKTSSTVNKYNQGMIKSSVTTNKTVSGIRRFNFAWLSVMFAGMALNRVFGSLIKSQLQLFGITNLFSGVLTLVMLPIMQVLLPLFLKLAEFFMGLPDNIKMAIGVFVLLGFVFGLFLLILGQIMLGVMGFTSLWATGGPIIMTIIGGVGATLGTVLIIIGLIIAAIIILYIAWKTNFMNMKNTVSQIWEGLKQTFLGLIGIFKGIFLILKGIFTGDFSLILEGAKLLWKGFADFMLGLWKVVVNSIVAIFKAGFMVVYNILKIIIDGLIWSINALAGLTGHKGNVINFKMPSFQTGGIVPQTGPALLHKGEEVIPANEVGKGREINIYQNNSINVSDKAEMQKMLDENNTKLVDDIKRQLNV